MEQSTHVAVEPEPETTVGAEQVQLPEVKAKPVLQALQEFYDWHCVQAVIEQFTQATFVTS
jgi:hypothetical protein